MAKVIQALAHWRRMFGGHIPILLIFLQLPSGGCDLLCPTINELYTTAELTCFTQNNTAPHAYSRSSSAVIASCQAPGTPCVIFNSHYSAKFVNSTHTVLTVISVTTSDAGSWTCTIQDMPQDLCDMEVIKTPRCSITSKEDTDVLAQYQQLKLTVDIQDYYCSTALTFSLQTGNVTTLLMEADSVANVSHNISSVTLDVTDSHLGAVRLIFSCHNNRWNISCDGVTELIPKTPTCNITSDKDTETLTLYEDVTLTVDIAAYYDIRGSYCSVDSNFTLQTGDVTQLLNVAGTGADHDLSPITFNVTETHLGDVRLIFNCQLEHWNLTCEGVGELTNRTKSADVPKREAPATASIAIVIACVFGAIVFLIIAVIIIMFLVKRKQVTRIKPQTSLKSPSPPYITVGAPGSSAYATVELNDAPSGSKNITVIDAGGYACAGDFVNNDQNRSSSMMNDESHKLSLEATSTDNSKNGLGVVVQHIIPEDNTSQINELYASINKTKDMTVHNDDTAI